MHAFVNLPTKQGKNKPDAIRRVKVVRPRLMHAWLKKQEALGDQAHGAQRGETQEQRIERALARFETADNVQGTSSKATKSVHTHYGPERSPRLLRRVANGGSTSVSEASSGLRMVSSLCALSASSSIAGTTEVFSASAQVTLAAEQQLDCDTLATAAAAAALTLSVTLTAQSALKHGTTSAAELKVEAALVARQRLASKEAAAAATTAALALNITLQQLDCNALTTAAAAAALGLSLTLAAQKILKHVPASTAELEVEASLVVGQELASSEAEAAAVAAALALEITLASQQEMLDRMRVRGRTLWNNITEKKSWTRC